MKRKVSELEGALLDAAVAKAEGLRVRYDAAHELCVIYEGGDGTGFKERRGPLYNPSSNWRDGGPIIEREWLAIRRQLTAWLGERWPDAGDLERGRELLSWMMRAYIASKLGEEVEL